MRSKIQKVIVVSSESHRFSNMTDFSAQNCLPKLSSPYNHLDAYNDSKLCCLMFALTVHKQLGLKSIAVHPGNMISSNLSRHWWLYKVLFGFVRPFAKSLSQVSFRLNHLHVTGFRKNFKTLQNQLAKQNMYNKPFDCENFSSEIKVHTVITN